MFAHLMAGLLLSHLHLPTPACTSWPTQLPCGPLLSLHLQLQAFLPTRSSPLSPPPAPHSNCHRIPRLPTGFPAWILPTCALNNPSLKTATHCSSNRDQTPEHDCKALPPPLQFSSQTLPCLHSPAPWPTFSSRFTQFLCHRAFASGQPLCLKCSAVGWAYLALCPR